MAIAKARRRRNTTRLRGYDYAGEGIYFVTIVTHRRSRIFGSISKGHMQLSRIGIVAQQCWYELPQHFPFVELDEFIFMPDHMHGLLRILHKNPNYNCDVSDTDQIAQSINASTRLQNVNVHACGPKSGALGAIVGSFKSAVSRKINTWRQTSGSTIWQRNYYEHIVRSDRELQRIRFYIRSNPKNWNR